MKNKLFITFVIEPILFSTSLAYTVPPSCSEKELLETSDCAIEGYVINMECGEAHDSEECSPMSKFKDLNLN
jgi:hypothetical protein